MGAPYPSISTTRLRLRPWVGADRLPFAAINADSRVAEHLPAPLDRETSDAFAARIEHHFAERGFGLWAVEVAGGPRFIGYIGLSVPHFEAHFTPCVEIGWRLAHEHWGRGYATEGAQAALDYGFEQLGLAEIVSFTVQENVGSLRVMEKIGMRRDEEGDFEHPALPEGHRLRSHVLYRIRRAAWSVDRKK